MFSWFNAFKQTSSIPNESLDSYLVSGGISSDSLDDLAIDRVDASTFRIGGINLSFDGDTNIPVFPNLENCKVYFYNNSGEGTVGVGLVVPDESIIIATFDSDDTRITDYRLSGNFAINTEVNKLIEHSNHILEGIVTVTNNITTVAVSWDTPIKIHLPSKAAGTAVVNTINPGTITLEENEVVYVSINRFNDSVKTVKKGLIDNLNLTADDQFLFMYGSNGQLISSIKIDEGFITQVTESDVTQHQSSITITESQISDLTLYTASDFDIKDLNDEDNLRESWNNKWDYDEDIIKAVKVDNTSNADTVNNLTVLTAVPEGALFTDTTYSNLSEFNNDEGFITQVTESDVTQHQSSITITESQISDLDKYTQAEVDLLVGNANANSLQEVTNIGSTTTNSIELLDNANLTVAGESSFKDLVALIAPQSDAFESEFTRIVNTSTYSEGLLNGQDSWTADNSYQVYNDGTDKAIALITSSNINNETAIKPLPNTLNKTVRMFLSFPASDFTSSVAFRFRSGTTDVLRFNLETDGFKPIIKLETQGGSDSYAIDQELVFDTKYEFLFSINQDDNTFRAFVKGGNYSIYTSLTVDSNPVDSWTLDSTDTVDRLTIISWLNTSQLTHAFLLYSLDIYDMLLPKQTTHKSLSFLNEEGFETGYFTNDWSCNKCISLSSNKGVTIESETIGLNATEEINLSNVLSVDGINNKLTVNELYTATLERHLVTKEYVDNNIITVHNSLSELNEGDYNHLTQSEYDSLSSIDVDNIAYVNTSNVFSQIQTYANTISLTNDYEIVHKKYVDDSFTVHLNENNPHNISLIDIGINSLDDIDDGTTYVKSQNNFSDTYKDKLDLIDASNIAYTDKKNSYTQIQEYAAQPDFTAANNQSIVTKKYVDDNIVTEHNNLTSVQGGTLTQRYHLNEAQHTQATREATSTQNGLLSESDHILFSDKYTQAEVDSFLNNKANTTDIPANLSELNNDEGFITQVTESDVTQHQSSITITESQISDLSKSDITKTVYHGSNANITRPSGFGHVQWVGSIEPINAENNDTWIDTSD